MVCHQVGGYVPVIPDPPSSNESLLESVRELSLLAEVVIASGLCEGYYEIHFLAPSYFPITGHT